MTAAASEITVTDEDLAALAARRTDSDGALGAARDAFDRLYRRHAPLLLAFLAARGRRTDLDDVHQDVWSRVWTRLPDQFQGGNFRAWLYQIARHVVIDRARKHKPDALVDEHTLQDRNHEPVDQPLIEAERGEALRRCLEKLTTEAATLVRARLAGEDYTQVCARLGMASSRAYKVFHEAKAQLQACVERALS